MSKKKKNIPVPDPERSELEYTLPSASMSDMTGLIPADITDEGERDSYNDVIPYIPRSERSK
ncbi:MAG: hypothetical protein IJ779_08630 [Ruminococcus sp.]|nr:hypothetical protein [Ruminococcus sp.]